MNNKSKLVSAVMKVVESRESLEKLLIILYKEAKDGISPKTYPHSREAYRLIYEAMDKLNYPLTMKHKSLYEELMNDSRTRT